MISQTPHGHPADPSAPSYGPVVNLEGRLEVDPIAGGKALQAELLMLDDGETLIVAYRPLRAHLPYMAKRVRVRGRRYTPSPMVQAVMTTHFEVQGIELAPGERPWDPPLTNVPAPPLVRDGAALAARRGRWALCVGTLLSLEPDPPGNPYWAKGTFDLAGGGRVAVEGVPRQEGAFEALVGQRVTLLARVLEADRVAPRAICPGVVERCGMTLDNMRE